MSFADLVNKSWEDGKKGTDKVNLREGIDTIFKVAETADDLDRETARIKRNEALGKSDMDRENARIKRNEALGKSDTDRENARIKRLESFERED